MLDRKCLLSNVSSVYQDKEHNIQEYMQTLTKTCKSSDAWSALIFQLHNKLLHFLDWLHDTWCAKNIPLLS